MSCASQPANAQSGGEPVFAVTAKNRDDQVNVQYVDGITVIDVQSPTGIGWAKFELESGGKPENVVLRLHLKGLEGFRLISNQAIIAASASSSGSFSINNQQVNLSGSEYSISPIDPLWMKIEIVSGQANKKIPLEEGHFEITLPKEFIQIAGNAFEIQWIDFYR